MTGTSEFTPRSVAVVASAMLGAVFSGIVLANAAIAVFIGSIVSDYGWGHAAVGGAVSFLYLGLAVGSPISGQIVDRYGPRSVMLPLMLLSGVTLASLALVGKHLAVFYAGHFLIGLATPGGVAYSKLISGWFFRRRGIALTALGLGAAIAQVIVPPVARVLMTTVGWQNAYLSFGAAELLIAFPIVLLFCKERKDPVDTHAPTTVGDALSDGAPAIRVRDAMRGRVYWSLVGAQVAGAFAFVGISTHGVGILAEHGVSPANAVWGLSIFAAGGFAAQVATGFLLDRFGTPRVILPFAVASLLAVIVLQFSQNAGVSLAAYLMFGIGCGGQTSMTSYFTTRYFGVRNFSSIYGSLIPLLIVVGAPASVIIGAIFDATGSYGWALLLFDAILLIGIYFFAILGPYPYPVASEAGQESAHPGETPGTGRTGGKEGAGIDLPA